MLKKIKRLKFTGFTIIEALIGMLIIFLVALGTTKIITSFGIHIKKRIILSCLVQAANSAIEACKAGEVINSIECGRILIDIDVNGNCNPSNNTCNEVTATAKYSKFSFSLSNIVCNFVK